MWVRPLRPQGITSGPDRGFDTELAAYDFDNLGWKYTVVECGAGNLGIPCYQCQPAVDMPTPLEYVKDSATGRLLWPTHQVPPAIDQQEIEQRKVFNTNIYGKKSSGHEYTRVLTDWERKAIIEYLKTL